ncbi:MAG: hypothetical protein NUV67_01200 [archaeon]|nr:hypothetical protein [archaeon]
MVLFSELLLHVLALDINWLIGLFMSNLLWVFIFGSVAYFVLGKNPILGAVVIALYLFAIDDFMVAAGWVYRNGFLLAPLLGLGATACYDSVFPKGWGLVGRGIFASVAFYAALIFINVVVA